MSDIVKRLGATLRMGIIERGSDPREYTVAAGQVREAMNEIETLRQQVQRLEIAINAMRSGLVELTSEWSSSLLVPKPFDDHPNNAYNMGINTCCGDIKRLLERTP